MTLYAEPRPIMPASLQRLGTFELDALRELANIGAGHAATALSHMTGRTVDISVPTVSVAARGAVADVVGDGTQPLVLVRLYAEKPFTARLVIAMSEGAGRVLTNLLLGRTAAAHDWLDALGASAVKEVGNVLGASYLDALASVTGWTIVLSTPDLIYARADWAVELLANGHPNGDYALCLETSLRVQGADAPLTGHVLLFPGPCTVSALLRAVGVA